MKTVSVDRYAKEFKKQVDLLGYERAMKEMTPDTREELVRAFATGLPIEGSEQKQNRSIRGMSVAEGGDVIVKAIRVRYLHLRGWIEKQKSIKVRAVIVYCRILMMATNFVQ